MGEIRRISRPLNKLNVIKPQAKKLKGEQEVQAHDILKDNISINIDKASEEVKDRTTEGEKQILDEHLPTELKSPSSQGSAESKSVPKFIPMIEEGTLGGINDLAPGVLKKPELKTLGGPEDIGFKEVYGLNTMKEPSSLRTLRFKPGFSIDLWSQILAKIDI